MKLVYTCKELFSRRKETLPCALKQVWMSSVDPTVCEAA